MVTLVWWPTSPDTRRPRSSGSTPANSSGCRSTFGAIAPTSCSTIAARCRTGCCSSVSRTTRARAPAPNRSIATWPSRRDEGWDFGRVKYFVAPEILKSLNFPATTSLARIQPHRLEALVFEDLQRFPGSPISDIHGRIGAEIPRHQVKAALDAMVVEKRITHQGKNRWRRYTVVSVAIEKTS